MTEKARKLGEQPAFPVVIPEVRGGDGQVIQQCVQDGGMTIHQRFAMAAMQALVGHSVEDSEYLSAFDGQESRFDKWIGNRAVEIAEATIEALAARDL